MEEGQRGGEKDEEEGRRTERMKDGQREGEKEREWGDGQTGGERENRKTYLREQREGEKAIDEG